MQFNDDFMQVLLDRRPSGSKTFQLETEIEPGRLTLFPKQGGYLLDGPDGRPEYPECPSGVYRAYYCAEGGIRIPPRGAGILRLSIDLGLGLKKPAGSPSATAAGEVAGDQDTDLYTGQDSDAEKEDEDSGPAQAAELARIDREMHQAVMAQEIEDTAQDLLKKSQHVREISEHYAQHRVMRRDFQLLYEQSIENAKRLGDVIRHFAELHTDGMAKMKQQIDLYTRPPPPPPPPDYSALGQAAIALLRDISVALIQRSSPESGKALPGGERTNHKQLPPASAEASAPTGPPEPVLDADVGSQPVVTPPAPAAPPPQVAPVPPPTVTPPSVDFDQAMSLLRGFDEMQVAALVAHPELQQKFFELLGAAKTLAATQPGKGGAAS